MKKTIRCKHRLVYIAQNACLQFVCQPERMKDEKAAAITAQKVICKHLTSSVCSPAGQ